MYSLHPAGIPGGVWAGGVAVDDSDVVQSGWRSRLSTSFRAHWGGGTGSPLPPSPLSFAPIMAIPSPAFGRKQNVFAHTFPIWNKLEGVFCHSFGLFFFI